MGRTWKPVVLAAVVGLATICPAHAEPVSFVVDADARALLAQSHKAMPELNRSGRLFPDEPANAGADWARAAGPAIIAYLAVLELLLAVMAALACLLVLGLAGVVAKLQQRSVRQAVPARRPSGPFVFVSTKKLPV